MPKVLNKYKDHIPREAVYIGRPSRWGNPFELHKGGGNRKEVLAQYREWLLAQPGLIERVKEELAGKDLWCFCAPQACHGHLLMAIANGEPLPAEDAPLSAKPDVVQGNLF